MYCIKLDKYVAKANKDIEYLLPIFIIIINYSFDIRLVIKKIIIWKLLNYQ